MSRFLFRAALVSTALTVGAFSPASAQQTQPSLGEVTDLINTVAKNKDALTELSSGSSDTGTGTNTSPAPSNPQPSNPAVGTYRLTDQQRVTGNNMRSNVQVKTGGRTYENSLSTHHDLKMPSIDYALSNQFRNLNATIGVSDLSKKTAVKAVVKFIGDNRVIAEHEVAFPHTRNVNVNVANINRLRIEVYLYDTSTGKATSAAEGVIAYPTLSR